MRPTLCVLNGCHRFLQCVRTSTTIYPDTALIEEAARCISRFISSDNHNLKYLGINSLASIVQVSSRTPNRVDNV